MQEELKWDISDFLRDKNLVEAKKLTEDEECRQRRLKAEDSFDEDWFDAFPASFSDRHHIDETKFPEFLSDFLRNMHGVRFDRMTQASRRLLWKLILFTHKLSASDFPYPNKLEELDHPEPVIDIFRKRQTWAGMIKVFVGLCVLLNIVLIGMLVDSKRSLDAAESLLFESETRSLGLHQGIAAPFRMAPDMQRYGSPSFNRNNAQPFSKDNPPVFNENKH